MTEANCSTVQVPALGEAGERLVMFVDAEDAPRFEARRVHYTKRRGCVVQNRPVHRMLMDAPRGKVVDHINGNSLDNRKKNLRVCSTGENLRNSKKRAGTNPYKGVTRTPRGDWVAQIWVNYAYCYLGRFKTAEAAAKAYDEAACALHGEFAGLNFT